MNKDYCNCTYGTECTNNSKSMYSADYDNLIERLTSIRDEIDSVINVLNDRKVKDNAINSILSKEYEEEDEGILTEKDIDLLKKVLGRNNATVTYVPYSKKYPFQWYPNTWY